MLKLDKPLLEVVNSLEPKGELKAKLASILFSEAKRRLIEYNLIKKNMEKKYGMTLEEFEQKKMIEKLGYTEEVESDYITWDSTIDGINTMKFVFKKIRELSAS